VTDLVAHVRFRLHLDDRHYLLPEGTDVKALGARLGEAMRTREVLALDIEDPPGVTTLAYVQPSRARVAHVRPVALLGPPEVGKPQHGRPG
jgi:hypothetical protein